jgi:hypothetical protein
MNPPNPSSGCELKFRQEPLLSWEEVVAGEAVEQARSVARAEGQEALALVEPETEKALVRRQVGLEAER